MKILIVDDDLVSISSLQFIIEEHVKTIFQASNGQEGLDIFKKENPGIVITDINMPVMDGLTMATKIKELNPQTSIIITTTYSETRLLIRAIEIGISQFIFKPITGAKIREALKVAIEKATLLKTIDNQQRKLTSKVKELEELTLELGSIYGALKEKEALIKIDVNQAKIIQSSFFPSKDLKINNLKFIMRYEPVYDIGGDIYDIYLLPNGKVRIFIADATGHGIQASLITMLIKSEYEKVKKSYDNPAETLKSLNETFCGEVYRAMTILFTALIVDIDTSENLASFSTAGHPSFFLCHKEQINQLKSKGPIIGVVSEATFTTATAPFSIKDKIILYTDGLIEETNNLGETFDEKNIESIIRNNFNQSLTTTLNAIFSEFNAFINNRNNRNKLDDITTIGITYSP